MKRCTFLCLIVAVLMVVVVPALASDYSDAVTALDPVAWYRMDDATDSVGSNNGTASTGVSFDQPSIIPGETSLAAGFANNATGRISVPDSAVLDFGSTTDFSIETVVKRGAVGKTGIIASKGVGDHSFQFRYMKTGIIQVNLDYGSVTDVIKTVDSFDDDKYHHVVFSADRDGMLKLFVDGQVQAEMPASTWNGDISSDVNGAIGTQNGSYPYNGNLDEFAIYDTALSATQVLDHYNAGTGVSGNYQTLVAADSPVGWWRMDDAADSANGHTTVPGSGVTFGQTGAISGDTSTSALFDGTVDAYMAVGDAADLKFGTDTPISMEVWVKRDPSVAAHTAIWRKGESEGSYFMRMQDDGTVIFVLDQGIAGAAARGTTAVDDGDWHHIVGVSDRQTGVKLYVDGALDGEYLPWGADISNNSPLDMGAIDAGRYLNGTIDELVFYDQALSDADVLNLYTAATVPEPAVLSMLLGALLTIFATRRRN